MTYRLQWFCLSGLIAGCTSASGTPGTLPDRFDENLDVVARSTSHPCGADVDSDGDGTMDVRYTYAYDGHGRSLHDVGSYVSGGLYARIDYTWDNAGHLIHTVTNDAWDSFKDDELDTLDTLGRRLEAQFTEWTNDALYRTDVITYKAWDDVGHPLQADELLTYVRTGAETRTRSYRYDELGRRIGFDVRNAAGGLDQGWQYVYDDTARTVTWTLTKPSDETGSGFTDAIVDTYDAGYHLISRHDVNTSLDGTVTSTSDTKSQWSGDRQLSSTTTGDRTLEPAKIVYSYQCGGR